RCPGRPDRAGPPDAASVHHAGSRAHLAPLGVPVSDGHGAGWFARKLAHVCTRSVRITVTVPPRGLAGPRGHAAWGPSVRVRSEPSTRGPPTGYGRGRGRRSASARAAAAAARRRSAPARAVLYAGTGRRRGPSSPAGRPTGGPR